MKTTRKNLTVSIDWLTIIFEEASAREVIENYLEIPENLFSKGSFGIKYKQYDTRYVFGNIVLYSIEQQEEQQECYVNLSGEGCRQLEQHFERLGKTWTSFLEYCFTNWSEIVRMTRIDIAIDDKNEIPFFTIEKLHRKCLNELYKTPSQTYSFNESKFEKGITGKTLYVGAGKSNVRYRFYDKDKEQASKKKMTLEEIESWKRTEVQFRDDYATSMCKKIAFSQSSLGELILGFIKGHLLFISDKEGEKTVSRFWTRFLGSSAIVKLDSKTESTSLFETLIWIKRGGALSAIKAFELLHLHGAVQGLEDIEDLKKKARFSSPLSNKMIAYVSSIGREDLIPLIYENTKKAEF